MEERLRQMARAAIKQDYPTFKTLFNEAMLDLIEERIRQKAIGLGIRAKTE